MAMINRNFKDTVFRMIFGNDRKALLSLYNAVNNSSYENPDELVINTLEDAVYVSRKNDMSFVFRHTLNLYEHQSTLNPNLPLRNLFYVADLLQSMIDRTELYGSKRKKIDAPHFIMFYNGKEPLIVTEYRLSEMYSIPEDEPQLELIVKVVNISRAAKRWRSMRTISQLCAGSARSILWMKRCRWRWTTASGVGS